MPTMTGFTALAAFQVQAVDGRIVMWLTIFVGLVALALVTQALVVVALGVAALKAQKAAMAEIAELKGKALPLIEKSHALVENLSPKITALVDELSPKIADITTKVNTITAHVEHIAALAKDKADEFSPTITKTNETIVRANETVQDANLKTRAQIKRVDGLISGALDATVRLGVAIERGITVPGREVAGIVQGVKVGLETLIGGLKSFGAGAPVGRRPGVPARPASSPAMGREIVPGYPRVGKDDLGL